MGDIERRSILAMLGAIAVPLPRAKMLTFTPPVLAEGIAAGAPIVRSAVPDVLWPGVLEWFGQRDV